MIDFIGAFLLEILFFFVPEVVIDKYGRKIYKYMYRRFGLTRKNYQDIFVLLVMIFWACVIAFVIYCNLIEVA